MLLTFRRFAAKIDSRLPAKASLRNLWSSASAEETPVRLILLFLLPPFNYNNVKTPALTTFNAKIIHASSFPCFSFANQPDHSDTLALHLVTVSESNAGVEQSVKNGCGFS